MPTKVSDMTVEELRELIRTIVTDTMENILEDYEALNSPAFIQTIVESRADYKSGRTVDLDTMHFKHDNQS